MSRVPGSRIPTRADGTDRTTGRLGIGIAPQGGMKPPTAVGSRLPTVNARVNSGLNRPSNIHSRPSGVGVGGGNRPSTVGAGGRPSTDWSYQSYGDTMRLQGMGASSVKSKLPMSGMSSRKTMDNMQGFGARKSLLAGSMTPGQRLFSATPQSKRPSLNPGSAQSSARRQSLIGDRKHLNDPRPLATADYRHRVMNKLISLVEEHGIQSFKIPQRFHVSPTGSDIALVFNILFGFFDQKVKIERSNMDREVPGRLKMYGYPYTITKSVLTACTTPHAIGQLFGAYEYLIDCINYLTKVTPQQAPPSQQGGQEHDPNLNAFLMELAVSQLKGEITKNDVKVNIEEKAKEIFGSESEHMKMLIEFDRIKEENESLDAEIKEINELPKLIKTYKTDLEALEKWLAELDKQQLLLQDTLEANQNKLQERTSQMEALKQELAELEQKVKEQEFGPEEADMARQRQKQLTEDIVSENRQIDEMKRNSRIAKLDLKKYEDNVSKMAGELERFIIAIRDSLMSRSIQDHVKPLIKFINDEDWDRLLNHLVASKQKDKDVIEEISKKINELKLKITEHITSLQGSVLVGERDRLTEIEARIDDCTKAIKEEEEMCERIKSDNEKLKMKNSKELEELQNEFEHYRKLLAQADSKLAQSEDEIRDRIKTLRKEVAEREAEYNRYGEDVLARFKARHAARKQAHLKNLEVLTRIRDEVRRRNEEKREILAQNRLVEQKLKQMTKPRVRKVEGEN